MVSSLLLLLFINCWTLLASASEHELVRAGVVYPQLSCRDYGDRKDSFKEFPVMSNNFTECLDACDATPWCNVVQMQCGTTCMLHSECSTVKLSGCDTYLARARHREYPLQSFVEIVHRSSFNPWAAVLFMQILSICWTCAATDHFVKEDRYYDSYEAIPSPRDIFDGVNKGNVYGGVATVHGPLARVCFITMAFCVLFLVLSTSFIPFNHDIPGHPRGLCSLVGNDGQPLVWYHMFTEFFRRVMHLHAERDFQYQDGGVIHEGVEFMPMSCWGILSSDLVRKDTGLDCKSWCREHIGWLPRPMCGLVPTYGAVFRTCMKVETWAEYEWLMQVIPLSNFQRCWLIAFLYGGLAFLIGRWNAFYNTTAETRPPSRERCEADSPYGGRSYLYCWGRPSCDYHASRRELAFSMLVALSDPIFDINSFMVFFSNGQPWYALAFLAAVFAPNVHDPFQANHVELYLTSYRRGFRLRGIYIVGKRDGAIEGVVTAVVGIHALMRQSYYGYATWTMYFSIGLSAMTSIMLTLPAASIARDMLQSDLDFNDFYKVEHNKKHFGTRKWLATFDVLAFGIAVARTFSSNVLLMRLYLIGVATGMVQWLFYVFFAKQQVPHAKKVLRFTLAFIFWPMAVTRLLADEEVYNGMHEGTCRLSDAVLYGAASLHPSFFYIHRITSLVLFWTFAFFHRLDFVVVLARDIKSAAAQGTLLQLQYFQSLFVGLMLLIGWFSIIAEGALFYKHRKDFKLIHKAGRAGEHLAACSLEDDKEVAVSPNRRLSGQGSRIY